MTREMYVLKISVSRGIEGSTLFRSAWFLEAKRKLAREINAAVRILPFHAGNGSGDQKNVPSEGAPFTFPSRGRHGNQARSLARLFTFNLALWKLSGL